MPKLKQTSIIAKDGLNYFRSLVEGNGSICHKIEQENDFGIDAIIEFFDKGKPTNISIAFQIKSGDSYINLHKKYATISVDDHHFYWKEYPLPVFGIVYDPKNSCGYWINIKKYLKIYPNDRKIKIQINRTNILTKENYTKLFFPLMTKKLPLLEFEEAVELFNSEIEAEFDLGLNILFHKYVNRKETWDNFILFIKNRSNDCITDQLIYYIAHIPWHGDIGYFGEVIDNKIEIYAKSMLSEFDEVAVVKLLGLIDPDIGIQRGSIGQSIEAIISCITDHENILKKIIQDKKNQQSVRLFASLIYAYYNSSPIVFLKDFEDIDGVNELIKYLYEYGEINLYM